MRAEWTPQTEELSVGGDAKISGTEEGKDVSYRARTLDLQLNL